MPRPFFQIMQGEVDLTAGFAGRNLAMTLTDGAGANADTIQFSIDDANGAAPLPATGSEVRVIGGYRGGRTRDFGLFAIDSISLNGWPQTVEISGQSAGAVTALKAQRKASYKPADFPTYGDLFAEVARRNGLTLAASEQMRARPLTYEAQSEEDDLEFLSRIATKFDASVTVKSRHLVVAKKGVGLSASGQRLPVIFVMRGRNLLSYQVSVKDKPKFGAVKATWFDREKAETREVEKASFGEGPTYLLREPFASEEEAGEAAAAKAADLRRGIGTAQFDINGDPFAMAEAEVHAYACRALVDGVWRATTVTHNWSADGPYSTSIACESPDAGPTTTQQPLPALSTVPIPTPRPQ